MEKIGNGSTWILYRQSNNYYLESLCNHGPVSYTYTIVLTASEIALYEKQGSAFLDELAHDVHYSAPGAKGSTSKFRPRKASDDVLASINALH
ncbi:hypothetical protein D1Z90_10785 [Motilimonas pumila]|uniref:Uncharacterized protein n=1 Tax=Motilimonas pumila TaxID=2303987 RepID=A0A418YEN5_9GAMM|nr:hypothetical protein D1Z90_10785 [Motilimonas pumila]